MITDPVANALTKIRNAYKANHRNVTVNTNRIIKAVLDVMLNNGFISSFDIKKTENNISFADVTLKYTPASSIVEIKRISKPGRRVYVSCEKIPRVYNNLGIAILSTSKGVMSDKEARREKIGGEIICTVF